MISPSDRCGGRLASCADRLASCAGQPASCGCPPGRSPYGSRRRFLQALGGLGAASILPSHPIAAADASPAIVDTHHHFYAPQYQEAWLAWEDKRNIPHFPTQASWSRSKDLEEMDRNGVRTAILSLPSTPGLWFDRSPADASSMARTCNEYGADMVRSQPGRYGLFATLSMLDIETSLKELEYALDTLKADGVGLQTNYGDKWPGDALYRPIFEELNRRKAVVYFHPLVASCCARLSVGPGVFPAIIEVPHDTTRAVTSLLVNGSFARYRNIRWLFSHAGGTVPMLAGRIEAFMDRRKDRPEFAPAGIEEELKRLHYDTANATHPASMAALLKLVPVSQVVFGTDYPYFSTEPQRGALEKSGLSTAEVVAIESGNAKTLIPRLAGKE